MTPASGGVLGVAEREYRYRGIGGLGLAGLVLASAPVRYFLESDPYEDLQDIRRILRSRERSKPRSVSHRWGSKNTHRRERAKVAVRRKANVKRMQALRSAAEAARAGEA